MNSFEGFQGRDPHPDWVQRALEDCSMPTPEALRAYDDLRAEFFARLDGSDPGGEGNGTAESKGMPAFELQEDGRLRLMSTADVEGREPEPESSTATAGSCEVFDCWTATAGPLCLVLGSALTPGGQPVLKCEIVSAASRQPVRPLRLSLLSTLSGRRFAEATADNPEQSPCLVLPEAGTYLFSVHWGEESRGFRIDCPW